MNTQFKTRPSSSPSPIRYGITDKKKAELDALNIEVLDASYVVEQYQAIVTSLTEKANNFQEFLTRAEAERTKALNNKTLLDQLLQSTLDLQTNSGKAYDESLRSDSKTKELASQIKTVMDKLIYSAELINTLSVNVVRKKALNPLISDELVSLINAIGNDANNAVALTLNALNAAFAAQASAMESRAAFGLENSQSLALYRLMTGIPDPSLVAGEDSSRPSLKKLFTDAYDLAKKNHHEAHEAYHMTNRQLNEAQINLDTAQVKLNSLKMGLAAGNAVALAS